MLEFQEKRRIRSIIYSKWVSALLIVFLIIVGSATLNVYDKQKEVKKAKIKSAEEFNRLQNRATELEASIVNLETERGLEEEIRERFGVVSEGEKVIIVVDQKIEDNSGQQNNSQNGFWGKLFSF